MSRARPVRASSSTRGSEIHRSPAGADAIERCDVMLVTHGHHDHLGAMPGDGRHADSLAIARRTQPVWPAIHELSLWLGAQDTGADVVGMNKGGTIEAAGLRVTMVNADHSAGDLLSDAACRSTWVSPSVSSSSSRTAARVYHAGDTALFGDMRLISEMYRPDVAFLPIGGHFTMDPTAAARAVRAARLCHGRAHPLRHVPGPHGHARRAARGARAPRPGRRARPCTGAGHRRQLRARARPSGGLPGAGSILARLDLRLERGALALERVAVVLDLDVGDVDSIGGGQHPLHGLGDRLRGDEVLQLVLRQARRVLLPE